MLVELQKCVKYYLTYSDADVLTFLVFSASFLSKMNREEVDLLPQKFQKHQNNPPAISVLLN